ncbi:PREDICTED: putative nuclease HARBI1 [Trachymyrmex cornetzi]|uniref:putative nuclease HARBI1 n=1 Tax=Trachymyrmex cornetzi TaxID=471704 RepID=UPI00084F0CD8|nr:PREDICTED: putative nuclease HARBI1 [Trachymyrmex cornetzi]
MPDINECARISVAYEARINVPQVIGAIDGTHIPILPPADGYKDYINRKGWPSIILQAVVDNNLRFMNVNCQAPGSCHDAAVFKKSMLYKEAERIIPRKMKLINGVEIPYFLIGDPAYPLLPWLMKGYTKVTRLTPQEESFNVYLNSNRIDVERAFGLEAEFELQDEVIEEIVDMDEEVEEGSIDDNGVCVNGDVITGKHLSED